MNTTRISYSKRTKNSEVAVAHQLRSKGDLYLADNRKHSFNTIQRKSNKTGLPDQLKFGIENLSGHSLDDVKVHYNSSKPAQLNAHAYAQGTNIHLAPGQEKHLPHEAWHVVQQKQGRVRPTLQMNGTNINDNRSLESEADTMGARAIQLKFNPSLTHSAPTFKTSANNVVQRATRVTWTTQNFRYNTVAGGLANQVVGRKMEADLDPTDKKTGNLTTAQEMPDLFNGLNAHWNPGRNVGGWVRAHLLNAHLGGPNTDANLFPLTARANNPDHLGQVESHVKDWIRANRRVRYEVTASQDGGFVRGLRNAAGRFHCYAYTTDGGARRVVNKTIHSRPIPLPLVMANRADAAHVTVHDNNWFFGQHNNNMPGTGGRGNAGLMHPNNGENNLDRAATMRRQRRRGWFTNYYEL